MTLPRFASRPPRFVRALLLAGLSLVPLAANAWIITGLGTNNPRRVFLAVGNSGAFWANNATINTVTATLTPAQVVSGTAVAMTSNSTQSTSPYDNFTVCTPPAQVYVGAAYQRRNNADPGTATLQVTSPANLVNADGDAIPFTQISWTVSSLGNDANPNAIPPGTFNGGTQTLATVNQGSLIENCHTFAYANTTVRPSGTYTGRVTYTLVTP